MERQAHVREPRNEKLLAADGHQLPERWLARVATVWTGFAFTSLAGMATSYAAVWYVTESTGSPLALAVIYLCAFLPIGLLSPFGGVIADRFSRKAIIIACDSFLAITALTLACIILLGQLSLAWIFVTAALFGIEQAFRTPAFNSTMPSMVPDRHLLRINTLDGILSSISMICAPALGIFLYTNLGFQAVMLLDAAGGAAAALTMLSASIPAMRREQAREQSAWNNLRDGWQALASKKSVLLLVLGVTAGMMAYGPLDSLLPLMVSSHFGGDGYAASMVAGVFGAGMLAGSLILMSRGETPHLARIIIGAAFVVGLMTCLAGLLPSSLFVVFVIVMGLLAMACAGFNAPLMTILQKNIDEATLGRVMGLFSALMGLAVPLGTVLGGMLAEGIGVTSFFVVDGIVILLLAATLAMSQHMSQEARLEEESAALN